MYVAVVVKSIFATIRSLSELNRVHFQIKSKSVLRQVRRHDEGISGGDEETFTTVEANIFFLCCLAQQPSATIRCPRYNPVFVQSQVCLSCVLAANIGIQYKYRNTV